MSTTFQRAQYKWENAEPDYFDEPPYWGLCNDLYVKLCQDWDLYLAPLEARHFHSSHDEPNLYINNAVSEFMLDWHEDELDEQQKQTLLEMEQ